MVIFPEVSEPSVRPIQSRILWVPRSLSPEVKRPERETVHVYLVSKLGKYGAIPPLHMSSCPCCLTKRRENFVFCSLPNFGVSRPHRSVSERDYSRIFVVFVFSTSDFCESLKH